MIATVREIHLLLVILWDPLVQQALHVRVGHAELLPSNLGLVQEVTNLGSRCQKSIFLYFHLLSVMGLSQLDEAAVSLIPENLDGHHVTVHPDHVEDAGGVAEFLGDVGHEEHHCSLDTSAPPPHVSSISPVLAVSSPPPTPGTSEALVPPSHAPEAPKTTVTSHS